MRPLFEAYGVQVIALSKDSVTQAAFHKRRDGLSLTLLSDPKLEVIRRYGLEHHKAIEFKTWNVFGIPLGFPTGYKTMAIPTTLLVDADGKVRWIDQADDYRIRGDVDRIKTGLEESFGPASP